MGLEILSAISQTVTNELERIRGFTDTSRSSIPRSHVHKLSELELHIELGDLTTVLSATGTSSARIMLGEILAWLGCACRASSKEFDIEYWVPFVLGEDNGSVCRLSYAPETLEKQSQANNTCWQQIFKNPTIAKGYPVPYRDKDEHFGLEIPLKMAAVLGYARFATEFAGYYLLKGPCSALVAVAQSASTTV